MDRLLFFVKMARKRTTAGGRIALLLSLLFGKTAGAQFIDTSDDRVKTPLELAWKRIGTLKPRNTKEIAASRITVGCETLDRDFTNFNAYKAYLPPLGVKKIRLQAGWAKCEKTKGVYDWTWLDEIIDFAAANGLEPWLETSYGNPVYEGGGARGLLNSMMTSPEGFAAWDRWVDALVARYKDRVKEWEIWNEPDHPMQSNSPETTAELNIRTAERIKRLQPDAKIAGLALATHTDTLWLGRALKVFADRKKLDLFTWISYHSYAFRPEQSYRGVASFKRTLARYSPALLLRQGENGAPSTYIPSYALDKYYWTEYSQAKYDLRRLLGDLGRDVETSVFTIIDIRYAGNPVVMNKKGLIESDTSKAAIRPKVAYYAVQNLASVFDNSLALHPGFSYATTSPESVSVFGYEQKGTQNHVVALWLDGGVPSNSFQTKPLTLTLTNVNFQSPVWVDVLTGRMYEIPQNQWRKTGPSYTFTDVPLYDSPVLIAEKSVVLKNR